LSVPTTLVDQFWFPQIALSEFVDRGATAAMSLISAAMAWASASLKDEARRPAGAHPFAGTEHEEVAPHAGDLLLDLEGRAAADGHHGDHGPDADHDPEDRQEGAQDVAPDLAQGEEDGVSDHDGFLPLASSEATRPSMNRMTRPA
jgi:hypothetical protein